MMNEIILVVDDEPKIVKQARELGRPWWFLGAASEQGVCTGETDSVPRTGKP
jgi:hypothetical protein